MNNSAKRERKKEREIEKKNVACSLLFEGERCGFEELRIL